MFNDENVKQVEMNGDTITSNLPYCLFYRKQQNKVEVAP
jgi:hypothetical protein